MCVNGCVRTVKLIRLRKVHKVWERVVVSELRGKEIRRERNSGERERERNNEKARDRQTELDRDREGSTERKRETQSITSLI